jgi:hypothetical protein
VATTTTTTRAIRRRDPGAITIDEFAARLDAHDRRIEQLEQHHAGRDLRGDEDRAVLHALVPVVGELPKFSASFAWQARVSDRPLAEALDGADIDSPRSLGHCLRRLHRIGAVVEVGRDEQGLVWRIVEPDQ